MKELLMKFSLLIGLIMIFNIGSSKAQFTEEILATAWSPDGALVAAVGTNALVKVYDASSGALVHDFTGHLAGSTVLSVSWSADSTRIVTGATDTDIIIWNVTGTGHATGEVLAKLTAHEDYIAQVAWSPDGTKIVSVTNGAFVKDSYNIKLWDGDSYALLAEESGPNIYSVVWSPDSTRLAISAYAGAFTFEVNLLGQHISGAIVAQQLVAGHTSGVDWTQDSSQLAIGSRDGTIHFIDASTFTSLRTITTEPFIDAIAWSPDGTKLATASSTGSVNVWNTANGALLATYALSKQSLTTTITWSPDGTRLAYGDTGTTPAIVTPPSPSPE